MKSTRAPTSRRRASSTTRATWRSCARGSRRRRSCWPPRRRRSRPGSTPKADATAGFGLPLASARRGCPTSPWSTSSAKVRRAGRWLSPRAIAAVEEARSRGEQAMLFLNRRGYAPLTLCRTCGHRFECPNCSAWLVEHRFRVASSFAIIAAMSRAGRIFARNATRPTRSPPAARASSAWPRRRKPSFPTSARSCCHPTRRAGSRRCAASSMQRRAAPTTSSSARSWSPRGTISRF